jgi:hypothetical protein
VQRALEYDHLVESEDYPDIAQMILEWNEACVGNAALVLEDPWWRTLWR